MNYGFSRPGRSALIGFAMFVAGAVSLAWGIAEMARTGGAETAYTAAAIGLGGYVGFAGAISTLNFLWGMRKVARTRAGIGVIGRWTVPPGEFAAFREDERARRTAGSLNDYRLPRTVPPEGLEVIFIEDGVLIGDAYFGLVSTGLFTFTALEVLASRPRAIAFETNSLHISRSGRRRTMPGRIRLPVANGADDELRAVVAHFNDVLSARRIVNPGFYPSRMRIGIGGVIVGAVLAAIGFGLEAADIEAGYIPVTLAVVGIVGGLGAALLAIIAFRLHRQQYRGRR